jgi:integrase
VDTIAAKPEQMPFLGPHVHASDQFIEWATGYGLRSISLQLTALCIDDRGPPEALGGILWFLSRRDTLTVLTHWSNEDRRIRNLALLAQALAHDFPKQVPVPRPEFSAAREYRGLLETHYLSASFYSRNIPSKNHSENVALICLRVWLLERALTHLQNSRRADALLEVVFRNTRQILEESGDPRKRALIAGLLEPSTHYTEFVLRLQEKCLAPPVEDEAGWFKELKRTLLRIIKDEVKSTSMSASQPWLNEIDCAEIQFEAPEIGVLPSELSGEEATYTSLQLDPSDEEGGADIDNTRSPTPMSPTSGKKTARILRFQSVEDQQFFRYSWNRLRPDELAALKKHIGDALQGSDDQLCLLAAATALALVTGTSMYTVGRLAIASETSPAWALSPDCTRLHKLASRRRNRWKASDECTPWVRKLDGRWELVLAAPLAAVLSRALAEKPGAQCLADVISCGGAALESQFNTWAQQLPALGRVSSGLLARTVEQHAFDRALDSAFAKLVVDDGNAGIPGAGAYPSWQSKEVQTCVNAFADDFGQMRSEEPQANSMGSELDPLEERLIECFAQAGKRIEGFQLSPGHWPQYHNLVTSYCVWVLLAATGARPVSSVFESVECIDFERNLIYLSEKQVSSSESEMSGRVVPIPAHVSRFIRCEYLPYLEQLAEKFETVLPEFACEIRKLIAGAERAKLPLFFFLRQFPSFDWYQVGEASLTQIKLFDWPLPANVYRHRMAVRLRGLKLDVELIDAQMGHGEAGSETHGNYSARCIKDDWAEWCSAIELCFGALHIDLPTFKRLEHVALQIEKDYEPFALEEVFGSEQRKQERLAAHQAARLKAARDIEDFIDGREPARLPISEWDDLSRSMVLSEKNLPQPNALIRLEVLEKYFLDLQRNQGINVKIRNWWVARPKRAAPVKQLTVKAQSLLHHLRAEFDKIINGLQPTRVGKSDSALIAAIDLCLNARATDPEFLECVRCLERPKLALLRFEDRLYVEHCEQGISEDNRARKRYLAPQATSRFLSRAWTNSKEAKLADVDVPRSLFVFAAKVPGQPKQAKHLLKTLAEIVDADNAFELPGLVRAALSGAIETVSLDRHDWIRVRTGQCHTSPSQPTSPGNAVSTVEAAPAVTFRQPAARRAASLEAARALFRDIRRILNEYAAPEAKTDTQYGAPNVKRQRLNTDTLSRRDARNKIKIAVKVAGPNVSAAVQALGHWVEYLLQRPYKRALLDAASVRRYFDALAGGFVDFGSDLDITDADTEELTDFYMQVIDPTLQADAKNDGQEAPSAKKDQGYVLQRLQEFHRFAHQHFGVDQPDWSELGDGLSSATVSPGFISEREYLHALRLILSKDSVPWVIRQVAAFVLLLAFRFGLRGGEAISLSRSDWVEIDGAIVVLVRGSFKPLKTPASKRQVPLLEQLTDLEKNLVDGWFAYWTSETGNDLRKPLFFTGTDAKDLLDIRPIRELVISALRAATCNQHTNLHHTRHSFPNRVGAALHDRAQWKIDAVLEPSMRSHMKRLLVNTERPTRRSSWILARLLGHTSPRTTYASYCHYVFDWAEELIRAEQPERFEYKLKWEYEGLVSLDAWPLDEKYLGAADELKLEPLSRLNAVGLLKYFRLVAQGMSSASAALACRMMYAQREEVEACLSRLASKLKKTTSGAEGGDQVASVLRHIKPFRWAELIELVQHVEPSAEGATRSKSPDHNVGSTRQILLWREDHYKLLASFLKWLKWEVDSIVIYRPTKLDPLVVEWGRAAGLPEYKDTRGSTQVKFQLDKAIEPQAGQPLCEYPHRVAVVLSPRQSAVGDSFELMALWLAFNLGN